MKQIAVGKAFALVDDEDFEVLSQYRWRIGGKGYAVRHLPREGGVQRSVRMHRQILGLGPGDPHADHRNGNKLDCQRGNLRVATNQQNQWNIGVRSNNTSGFKGVSWDRSKGKWRAQVKVDGVLRTLGRFAQIEDAAAAYQRAARELHGEFVRL